MAVRLAEATPLLAAPGTEAEVLAELPAGTTLQILDKSRGWAWGYAGTQVGYVRASAL
jgi:hypothetical protein